MRFKNFCPQRTLVTEICPVKWLCARIDKSVKATLRNLEFLKVAFTDLGLGPGRLATHTGMRGASSPPFWAALPN